MKSLIFLAVVFLACAVAGAQENKPNDGVSVTVSGADHPEAFSLEEIAAGVFGGLADMDRKVPGSAERFLKNNFDLSSEGINRLVNAANVAHSQQPAPRMRAKEICSELGKATTREEYLVVLRTTYAEDLAQEIRYCEQACNSDQLRGVTGVQN
jgi:hypothetical protein